MMAARLRCAHPLLSSRSPSRSMAASTATPPPAAPAKLILALGDSHTFGKVGADWVSKAQAEHAGAARFVNGGAC